MLPELPIKFDLPLARTLAEFSRRAYDDGVGELEGKSKWNTVIFDKLTDAHVLMEDIGDAIVLSFRGTKDIRDWLTDAKFFKAPLAQKCDPEKFMGANYCASKVEVHSGFLEAADSILPDIIQRLNGNAKPLIITGHSLGGALATLAAFCLSKSNYLIRAVYTFASPRVGNAAFRAAYNSDLKQKTFRVAAAGDLVPLIPGMFCPPCDGYRHVGQEVFLQNVCGVGLPKINPSRIYEISRDAWRAWRAMKRGDLDFILQFHSIEKDYQKLLA